MALRHPRLKQLLLQQGFSGCHAASSQVHNLAALFNPAARIHASSVSPALAQKQEEPQAAEADAASQAKASQQETGAGASTASGSQSSHSSEQASSSSTEDIKSKLHGAFSGFSSRFGGSSGRKQQQQAGSRVKGILNAVVKEVKSAILPQSTHISATRAPDEAELASPMEHDPNSPSALVLTQQQQTVFDKAYEQFKEKFGHHPLFQRMSKVRVQDSKVYKKGQEFAEDLRDKYETSDHPFVHKVEDVKERLFSESGTAQAMREMRARDPKFDMIRFMAAVKMDAPVVVKAFLTHDLETLSKHCGPELMERFAGIFKHFEAEGVKEDPTILFVGDPEIVEMKMEGDDPLLILQFHCQQIKCTRDKFGNVVEGSPDSIQRVFYFWGLTQEKQGYVLANGTYMPPRWVIRDMLWQAVLALV